jgi:hypothetical protein
MRNSFVHFCLFLCVAGSAWASQPVKIPLTSNANRHDAIKLKLGDYILQLEPISHDDFEVVLNKVRARVSRTYRAQLEKRLG